MWSELLTTDNVQNVLSIVGIGGGLAALRWRKYISLGIFVVKRLKMVGHVKTDLELAAELGNAFGEELSKRMTKKFGKKYVVREVVIARFFREAVKGALRDNK